LKVVEIDNLSGFLALEEKWNDVLSRCDHNVFSTWEWLTCWWKHFGKGKRLVLLLAEEDDGKIIGIAPLMYSVHKMFGLRRGKIEFIGTPDSDYNDFILAGKEDECIKLFINYLNSFSENWDCIDLTDIPENAKCITILGKMSGNLKPVHKCPYSPLPKSYDLFLKDLSRNLRYDLRRDLRRVEKSFKVEFADYSGIQSLTDGMNIFFELHQGRWKSKGFSGVFADQKLRNFDLEIAKSFSQKGWLGLFLLKLSGNPVAALYGFKYRSKFYYYLPGFDPRYSRYGVGNLILSHVIAKCIQERLAEFDFLRGVEAYKNRWNTLPRWNKRIIIPRKNFLGNFRSWLYEEYWLKGSRLKYVLRIKR
jgi:CelD/BcsL family acetyltransferase involved in cellulose biosynthesis